MTRIEKIKSWVKELPKRTVDYFKNYYKTINWLGYIASILLVIGLFLTDYFSKINAFYYLTNGDVDNLIVKTDPGNTTIIPHILNLFFTQNKGAAWGIGNGQMWFLVIISFVASLTLSINLLFRFNKYNKVLTIGMILMASGAIGNLVDRIGCLAQVGIYKGGVIDFLQFTFWKSFPICNLADYYLTIGIVFLIIGFIIEFRKEYEKMKEEENASSLDGDDSKFIEKLHDKERNAVGGETIKGVDEMPEDTGEDKSGEDSD